MQTRKHQMCFNIGSNFLFILQISTTFKPAISMQYVPKHIYCVLALFIAISLVVRLFMGAKEVFGFIIGQIRIQLKIRIQLNHLSLEVTCKTRSGWMRTDLNRGWGYEASWERRFVTNRLVVRSLEAISSTFSSRRSRKGPENGYIFTN